MRDVQRNPKSRFGFATDDCQNATSPPSTVAIVGHRSSSPSSSESSTAQFNPYQLLTFVATLLLPPHRRVVVVVVIGSWVVIVGKTSHRQSISHSSSIQFQPLSPINFLNNNKMVQDTTLMLKTTNNKNNNNNKITTISFSGQSPEHWNGIIPFDVSTSFVALDQIAIDFFSFPYNRQQRRCCQHQQQPCQVNFYDNLTTTNAKIEY